MNKDLKPVRIPDWEPLQCWYKDQEGNRYAVARLIDEAKELKPFDLPLSGIDLSKVIWVGSNLVGLARHVKIVNEVELRYPIILDWEGRIADGRHRIIKALIEGRKTIKAVRLPWRLEPCKPADS